jgi:magnesium transporter
MSNKLKPTSKKAGLAPGSLVYVGTKELGDVKITIIDYDAQHLHERTVSHLVECFQCKETPTVSWINIDGIQNPEVMEAIGKHFGLHNLTLEDIMNTEIRPKIEIYDNYILVILKMLNYDSAKKEIISEQVSLVLGENFVLSFQDERKGDVFDPIRLRIQNANSKIRRSGNDFLLYALIDTVVDNYFIVLEKLGEKVEVLEEEIIYQASKNTLNLLYRLKRELIYMRKSVWPLREVVSSLYRDESRLIRKDTHKYLRDIYDHTIQVIDTTESYRDVMASLLDIYLSGLSNKTNETMKVLTIISTIFMPLTFIAGIYGMNFEYMPELKWKYGYFEVMAIMAVAACIMLYWFRRKRWL